MDHIYPIWPVRERTPGSGNKWELIVSLMPVILTSTDNGGESAPFTEGFAMRKTRWMAFCLTAMLVSSVTLAQESAYQFTVGVFDSHETQTRCPVALMSAKGDLVARCTPQEPDEGPTFHQVTVFSVDGKGKPRVFDLGVYPDAGDKEFMNKLKKLNEFLKKRRFSERGQSAVIALGDMTFSDGSVVVRHNGAEYRGSTRSVKLADDKCCDYSGLDEVAVFPDQRILVGVLTSQCRDNQDETRPCDCDGHYPMGDEDIFRWCPTGTSGVILLREAKPEGKVEKRN